MSIRLLWLFSIGYLLIPNALFFVYWTNSVVGTLGVFLLAFLFGREILDKTQFGQGSIKVNQVIKVGLIAFIIVLFSGIGGFAHQTVDHWGHNVKFYALFREQWPLVDRGSDALYSYYFGFYLVPALLFKLVGVMSPTIMIIWTWIGLSLGLLWINSILNGKLWLVLIVFFTGDIVHFFVVALKILNIHAYDYVGFRIGFWSAYENFLWAPNQVIPSTLLAGMLTYLIINRGDLLKMVFPISLSFWWAVFPVFFLAVYLIVLVLIQIIKKPSLLLTYVQRFDVIVPLFTCLPVLILYLSKQTYPVGLWAWELGDYTENFIKEYGLNIIGNLLLMGFINWFIRQRTAFTLPSLPLMVLIALTIIFSLYIGGEHNDSFFRGVMPYLIIMGIYIVYPISGMNNSDFWGMLKQNRFAWFVILFMLGSTFLLGIVRFSRALINNKITANIGMSDFEKLPFDQYDNIYEVITIYWSEPGAKEYLGQKGSFYEKYIAPRDLSKTLK